MGTALMDNGAESQARGAIGSAGGEFVLLELYP